MVSAIFDQSPVTALFFLGHAAWVPKSRIDQPSRVAWDRQVSQVTGLNAQAGSDDW